MESLAWILVLIATITGILAIAMIISYMTITRDQRYWDAINYAIKDECDCGCEQGGLDICSSECDNTCRENDHR